MGAQLLLLVGAKGAGKTTLGRMLGALPGVHFFEVERIAKRVAQDMGGVIDDAYIQRTFGEILAEVERLSSSHPVIVLETTGAADQTQAFVQDLRRGHPLALVRVHAAAKTCAERLAFRDTTHQVVVPPELIQEMQQRTEALNWPWDLEIHNDPPLDRAEVIARFAPLLAPWLPPTGEK